MEWITTKRCGTCEHYPNDKHCIGCKWDEGKRENTKWELKKNPIVIERAVLDKIRAEITAIVINGQVDEHTMFIRTGEQVKQMALDIIDKYKAESEE